MCAGWGWGGGGGGEPTHLVIVCRLIQVCRVRRAYVHVYVDARVCMEGCRCKGWENGGCATQDSACQWKQEREWTATAHVPTEPSWCLGQRRSQW